MRRALRTATLLLFFIAIEAMAQNRGAYPLGMSAIGSGVMGRPGFTYNNQLLYYYRDHARDDLGNRTSITGQNDVLMDMNTFLWVEPQLLWGDTKFAMAATLPFARNSLTSDVAGEISGGRGFADSYYLPLIFGWERPRYDAKVAYGFLAPTGRFDAGANDNVGSGYWTHTASAGQTLYLTRTGNITLSAFEIYEYHTKQEDTQTRPGDTFDLDYSLMGTVAAWSAGRLDIGVVGYNARQMTAKEGPNVTVEQSETRYAVNGFGFALVSVFSRGSLGVRYFNEFNNRSTYQGYSMQFSGSISF